MFLSKNSLEYIALASLCFKLFLCDRFRRIRIPRLIHGSDHSFRRLLCSRLLDGFGAGVRDQHAGGVQIVDGLDGDADALLVELLKGREGRDDQLRLVQHGVALGGGGHSADHDGGVDIQEEQHRRGDQHVGRRVAQLGAAERMRRPVIRL